MASVADSQPDLTTPETAPGLWAKLTDNPLLTILGTAIAGLLTILGTSAVGLLIFTLTKIDNRISRLEDRVDAGFAAVDARFADQNAKIDALDAKIDEINLKLTALIAAFNASDEIEAALEGRLLDSGTGDAEPSAPGPG